MPEAITQSDSIELKDHIPESVRTSGKDDAAEYIQTEVIDKGRWPMDMTDMAKESGWSRQHIRNTLDAYFKPANESDKPKEKEVQLTPDRTVYITIPEDADEESFLRGYFSGWLDARNGAGF